MRHGPLLFLGLLGAMALSWLGMIATPQFQLGNVQPTNVPPANVLYPTPDPGLANVGREIYRANGCAYCHTEVVRQQGALVSVVISNPGTNAPATIEALRKIRGDLTAPEAERLLAATPATALTTADKSAADRAAEALSASGAEASVRVVPTGPEIERGWGTRLSVARDYIYHAPFLLGSIRLGPDLTNVGLRQPDAIWHLVHLYDPKLKVERSIMPRYRFLFEERPRGAQPAPDALPIPGTQDVIPKPEAYALVAYLLSRRADMPLFEAPAPMVMSSGAGAGSTNAQAAATNALSAPGTNSSTEAAPR